jgi:hypothetical protein
MRVLIGIATSLLLTVLLVAQTRPTTDSASPTAAGVDCAAFQRAISTSSQLAALERHAQPPPPAQPRTYPHGVSLMGAAEALIAASEAEDGATRTQLHELRIANYLHLIDLNLTVMSQHKCALPREPFNLPTPAN